MSTAPTRHFANATQGFRAVFMFLLVSLGLSGHGSAQSANAYGVAHVDAEPAVTAWYGDPTTRYPHGALGEAIEAGSLIVEVGDTRYRHILPQAQVFEDDMPRLVDLDQDGAIEIVTIRTDVAAGAAVAVYNVNHGGIVERAATPPIGQPNRWLSIAAIDSFAPDGRPMIAVVRTPHIGGGLDVLELRGDELVSRYPRLQGVTSHIFGDPVTSFAATADMDGDGRPDLLLTDLTRRNLLALSFDDGEIRTLAFALPVRLNGSVTVTRSGHLQVPLENGAVRSLPLAD